MRVIKFRFWYEGPDSKFFRVFTLEEIMNGDPFEVMNNEPFLKNHKMTDEEQFTGLLDKNGKEIYEGDILDDGGGTGEVRWIPEHCAFCVVSPDCGIGASFHHLESGDGKRLLVTVVIGNIHEDKSEVK
jgi:hypothetical protein